MTHNPARASTIRANGTIFAGGATGARSGGGFAAVGGARHIREDELQRGRRRARRFRSGGVAQEHTPLEERQLAVESPRSGIGMEVDG